MNAPILCWFRHDLRMADQPMLAAAAKSGRPVICVYILDDSDSTQWKHGSARRWWLHHSLSNLSISMEKQKLRLILRRGNSVNELIRIIDETKANSIYFSRQYDPYGTSIEKNLTERLNNTIKLKRFRNYLLFEPDQVLNGKNEPYKVFTPFYRACLRQTTPHAPTPTANNLKNWNHALHSDSLMEWKLLPSNPDWASNFHSYWTPGEAGAHQKLDQFISGEITKYDLLRNRPDVTGTSHLSPHLHFGEISPRQIWHAIINKANPSAGVDAYIRQLVWRDFANNLLFHWPQFPEEPFRKEYSSFPWKPNEKLFKKWQSGQTGYPIVDAGMRELWSTGWMHNRVRMIVASFLVKDLLIPWQQGESWFWDTLLDADLANNAASWQWVAGCGADASPYYRIFNPILQGKKFDPLGDYVRQWVPELKNLDAKHIHSPWLAPHHVLKSCGIRLNRDYPKPVVDHDIARKRALTALEKVKAYKNSGK